MTKSHTHASHPKVAARLKRAGGHLSSVVTMIEEGRPCSEIAQQLHAVEKAIINAKRVLIHDHIDNCLEGDDTKTDMEDLKTIARYL